MELPRGSWLVAPFVLLWVVGWSAGTLFMDYQMVRGLYQQGRTSGFVATEGRVLTSRVDVECDSESTTYHVKVRYEYLVEGVRYESDQLHYISDSGHQAWARAKVASLPPGAATTVYYDPDAPRFAVLTPGLRSHDLLTTLFGVPFNLVTFGSWALIFSELRGRDPTSDLPHGATLIEASAGTGPAIARHPADGRRRVRHLRGGFRGSLPVPVRVRFTTVPLAGSGRLGTGLRRRSGRRVLGSVQVGLG